MKSLKNFKKDTKSKKKKDGDPLDPKKFVSSGSMLLNLACTGKRQCGFKKGTIVLLAGKQESGKTFFAMTCLAEAAKNPNFDSYDFVFDNAENGALMDIKKFFGQRVAEKLQSPSGDFDNPKNSETVEDLYYNLDDRIKRGVPFIYIIDSMDALSDKETEEIFDKNKRASQDGKEAKGSYATGKSKTNSARLRTVANRLRKSGSILIMISQLRQNFGPAAMFVPDKRSGGNALSYYARMELWTKVVEKIKTKVKGKTHVIGAVTNVTVKKNSYNGWHGSVDIPFYRNYGIDDIRSAIAYLIDNKHWTEKKGRITAPEFDFEGPIDSFVSHVEFGEEEDKLQEIVQKLWREIDEQCTPVRKSKYD